MTPNPIHKVLSTLAKHQVQFLLMGGQACVFYGAAEFSRDTDIVILLDPRNLDRLKQAVDDLQAKPTVPPFEEQYLQRGHAVHFRCHHPQAIRMRLDVMAKMRGVDPFPALWQRRWTLEMQDGLQIHLLDLPDLIQSKKTQRDKDWPMIARLVEAHHAAHRSDPALEQILFWFQEARTAPLLRELATSYSEEWKAAVRVRPLLKLALGGKEADLEFALREEERKEREADRAYWLPLKRELENLRQKKS